MTLLLVSTTALSESGCIAFVELSDWTAVNLVEWQTLTISLVTPGSLKCVVSYRLILDGLKLSLAY